jgi:hypothetical protein
MEKVYENYKVEKTKKTNKKHAIKAIQFTMKKKKQSQAYAIE